MRNTLLFIYILDFALTEAQKMEDENGKRNGFEPTGDVIGKRLRTTEDPDGSVGIQEEDDREMTSWLMLDEDSAMELSKLLDSWDAPPPPVKVRFIENPYSSTVIFQSSSAYVTINGNEETCGSSFSDSDSSVMASIDLGGIRRVVLGEMKEESGGAWPTNTCENGMDADRDLEMEGFLVKEISGCDCSGSSSDDQIDYEEATWLKFLGEDVFGSL
ncbi:uncharacterized protein LOC111397697 [Olea europaea var. sylvestris]|uniref:uncharacterized protein LOC111397697 n=1 Tax=Olea europaea var. sylvestris TaxID=158386 RepID=UPI000C1D6D3E|nr:uncharacterized protein LOC111397697 [Olea europaea var. sylvestris]